jgi:hypothetical protein
LTSENTQEKTEALAEASQERKNPLKILQKLPSRYLWKGEGCLCQSGNSLNQKAYTDESKLTSSCIPVLSDVEKVTPITVLNILQLGFRGFVVN